jgi:hypothetical protein
VGVGDVSGSLVEAVLEAEGTITSPEEVVNLCMKERRMSCHTRKKQRAKIISIGSCMEQ